MDVIEPAQVGMGSIHYGCCDERLHTPLLNRLSESERVEDSGFVPDTAHGRMNGFARPP